MAQDIDTLVKKAMEGDIDMQLKLAKIYEEGIDVPKDKLEAIRWYLLAADFGSVMAHIKLGQIYEEGLPALGINADPQRAIRYYKFAVDKNDPIAQYLLGRMYAFGGIKKDEKEAVKLFELAAKQGNADAQSALAFMYREGNGVKKDPLKAVEWYRLAAAQNHEVAIRQLTATYLSLGYIYSAGLDGFQQNKEEAEKWFLLAAERQNKEALRWLISNKERKLENSPPPGAGEIMSAEDLGILEKAAKDGSVKARFKLAKMYEEGLGVAEDKSKAEEWYKLAAESGNLEAQLKLAQWYREDQKTRGSLERSLKYYNLAAAQGDAIGQLNAAYIYEVGIGVEKNLQEAVRLYTLAANQGNTTAQGNLAGMYAEGRGVEKNPQEAIRLYDLAIAKYEQESGITSILRLEILRRDKAKLQNEAAQSDKNQQAQVDSLSELVKNEASDNPQDKIAKLKEIISTINQNIVGKDAAGQKVTTGRWTHDASGPKIQVLKALEDLLDKKPSKFGEQDLETLIKLCLGIYQVKRHKLGFFPESFEEFKKAISLLNIKIPENIRTFTNKDLKALLTDNDKNIMANLEDLIRNPDKELNVEGPSFLG